MEDICNGDSIIEENLQKEIEKDLIDQYDYSLEDAEKFAKDNMDEVLYSMWSAYYKYLNENTRMNI
jgi:hypothetical protein